MNPGVLRADDSVPAQVRVFLQRVPTTSYCAALASRKMGWGRGLTRVWEKALRREMSLTLCSCSSSCCVKTTNWTRNFVNCDACSTSGYSGTKLDMGGSEVRSAGGLVSENRSSFRSGECE
jgi:hypothetical protein